MEGRWAPKDPAAVTLSEPALPRLPPAARLYALRVCSVASAPGGSWAAGVRVWQLTSWDGDPEGGAGRRRGLMRLAEVVNERVPRETDRFSVKLIRESH
jgi:hypothetical protein